MADELIGLLVNQRSELVDDGFGDDIVRTDGETLLDRAATMLLLDCSTVVDARVDGARADRVPDQGGFLDSVPETEGSASLIIAAGGGIVGGRVSVGVPIDTGHED